MQIKKIFARQRYIILYGFLSATLVMLLKWLQWKYLVADHSLEIYIGVIALLFTALGVWVATKLHKPKIKTILLEREVFVEKEIVVEKKILVEKEVPVQTTVFVERADKEDQNKNNQLNLTSREMEVLQLMVAGKSNAEIAAELYLSVSTIKTHASNLFFKMDVRSRTQAIVRAKSLGLGV